MAFSKQLNFRHVLLWKKLCSRSLFTTTPVNFKNCGYGFNVDRCHPYFNSKCLSTAICSQQKASALSGIKLNSPGNRTSSLFTDKSVLLIDVIKMSASTAATPSGSTANIPPPGKQEDESNAKSESTVPPVPKGELSTKDKLKQAIRDYGSTVLVFHVTMSLMSLGFFYVLVSSGLDVVGLLTKIGISESITQSKITEEAGKFVDAYAVHKVFAPLRITITLTATPFIVRKLRNMGILKQMAKPKSK